MFDFDNFREIWSTVKKNKLRTFLTGFSVAWGIFMLILLLGAGNGLRHGIMHNFRGNSTNQVFMWPRWTTMAYQGMQSNRRIQFKTEDIENLRRDNPEIDLLTGIIYRNEEISYGEEYNSYSIRGIHPDMAKIEHIYVLPGNGRFINEMDIRERRKVIVISERLKEVLFRSKDPLGEYVKIASIPYQVVGIGTREDNDYDPPVYIPFSTAQTLYKSGYGVDELTFTILGINNKEEAEAFEQRVRAQMARYHKFDPSDMRAIGLWNTLGDFLMLNGMLNGITFFIWIIGIGTLTAGIVGVSNIMLITVRERTREFGIRKAIGATPFSILKLVIIESIIITAIFGYLGMVLGIGITEGVNTLMESMSAGQDASYDDMSIFRNPTVSLNIALSATVLIVAAGILAGYFPARKAVKVTAIEAMRHE